MNLLQPTIKNTNPLVRQIRWIFFFSIAVLLITSLASYYTLQRTIDSIRLVNHTNTVLLEAENCISIVKDAETSQRGYLLAHDDRFLVHYIGSYDKATASINKLKSLTNDNPNQILNINRLDQTVKQRFSRLEEIMRLDEQKRLTVNDYETLSLVKGQVIMDQLRDVVNTIKNEEQILLTLRTKEQNTFISYTSPLLIIAFLVSLTISILSYIRIKSTIQTQAAQALSEQQKHKETITRINAIEATTKRISAGEYDARCSDNIDDELGRISTALNNMTATLEGSIMELEEKNWIQTGTALINDAIRNETDTIKLAKNVMNTIASYIDIAAATFYVSNEMQQLDLAGTYSTTNAPLSISKQEGLLAQAVKNGKPIYLTPLPPSYPQRIASSIGSTTPISIFIIPLKYSNEINGVIEVCFIKEPKKVELYLLEYIADIIASGVNTTQNVKKLQELLEETQAQTEELQAQHNELENMNAELEAQAHRLQVSEEELKVQQEELQESNKELEIRSKLLEERNELIAKNAEELSQASKYKSEFLANISHELRTPLNSILLLSRLLHQNSENSLSAEQIEYARVIQNSGTGLLALIDEILDLSKIEAGKMDLMFETFSISELAHDLQSLFNPIAVDKNIELEINLNNIQDLTIETDKLRLDQVLKNLLSNALKFTTEGKVTLNINKVNQSNFIQFKVKDTGIGISKNMQSQVFEAFQQADGSTRRKFGGTGLGLSISKKLIELLGGDITLTSEEGKGSEFTVSIPVKKGEQMSELNTTKYDVNPDKEKNETSTPETNKYVSDIIPQNIIDDRNNIHTKDQTILIVEDDVAFAKILLDFTHQYGYKGIVAVRGDEGIEMALKHNPVGILLDIQLPVKSGWEVMDVLKTNPKTRHIPVHIMSSYKVKNESLLKGAIDFINKPIAIDQLPEVFSRIERIRSKENKKVLIIEDNTQHAKALAYYLDTHNINSAINNNINDGLTLLKRNDVDCVILDMGIPDNNAYRILEEAKRNPEFENVPIIIFTGKSLSMSEEKRIKQYADSIIIKTAHSYQRMFDEVSLFLHIVTENQENKAPAPKKQHPLTDVLHNKTVLVVDDDVRNIFSLSKSLEHVKMNVITATDGKEALQKLDEHPEINVVLLDMMMPEMDGYETATRIRERKKWETLPVIAVTAKAMTGDREKCISAGASDYITKPVDIDQLLSLLRVWLFQ